MNISKIHNENNKSHTTLLLQEVAGIPTLVLSPPDDLLSWQPDDPFCVPKPCLPSGLLRVSACNRQQPLAISNPHFAFADIGATNKVTGLNPDPEKHITKFFVEPATGLVIQVRSSCLTVYTKFDKF